MQLQGDIVGYDQERKNHRFRPDDEFRNWLDKKELQKQAWKQRLDAAWMYGTSLPFELIDGLGVWWTITIIPEILYQDVYQRLFVPKIKQRDDSERLALFKKTLSTKHADHKRIFTAQMKQAEQLFDRANGLAVTVPEPVAPSRPATPTPRIPKPTVSEGTVAAVYKRAELLLAGGSITEDQITNARNVINGQFAQAARQTEALRAGSLSDDQMRAVNLDFSRGTQSLARLLGDKPGYEPSVRVLGDLNPGHGKVNNYSATALTKIGVLFATIPVSAGGPESAGSVRGITSNEHGQIDLDPVAAATIACARRIAFEQRYDLARKLPPRKDGKPREMPSLDRVDETLPLSPSARKLIEAADATLADIVRSTDGSPDRSLDTALRNVEFLSNRAPRGAIQEMSVDPGRETPGLKLA